VNDRRALQVDGTGWDVKGSGLVPCVLGLGPYRLMDGSEKAGVG
jgi:hypothetical protein